MPEGPETKRMVDGISRSLVNKKIEYYPLKVNNCMSCGSKTLVSDRHYFVRDK